MGSNSISLFCNVAKLQRCKIGRHMKSKILDEPCIHGMVAQPYSRLPKMPSGRQSRTTAMSTYTVMPASSGSSFTPAI